MDEAVKLIENSHLIPDMKVELLLVVAGVKPATDIDFYSPDFEESETPPPIDEADRQATLKLVEDLGMPHMLKPEELENVYSDQDWPKRKKQNLVVANTPENLNKLEHALTKEDNQAKGEAYGFPSTAIEAWLEDQTIYYSKMPKEVHGTEAYAFGRFAYSPEHWRDELKTGQMWADTVKKLSPRIYKEYMYYYNS